MHFHENFDGRICHHLLCAFLVSLHDACIVLGGDNGGYAEAAPLCQHDFKAGRNDSRVLVHDAQVRPDAYGISGQGFQHISGVAFDIRAEANGAGVADGGKTDFAEAGEFGGSFFQRRQ